MFTELLEVAAHSHKIVGVRVRPTAPNGFEVSIWMGPRSGERIEWSGQFSEREARMDAINLVAAQAIEYCHEHGDCAADQLIH